MELTNESIILNNSAHQKLSTVKPETIWAAIMTRRAFITNKNKPKVTKVMGIVRKINMGFMVILSSANKAAMIIPVK